MDSISSGFHRGREIEIRKKPCIFFLSVYSSMDSPWEHEFLFIHSARSPGSQSQDERTKQRKRRHVMRDIGKARRKSPRNPQMDFVLPRSARPMMTSGSKDVQACPSWYQLGQAHRTILVTPFWDQHPIALMHENWGMNPFAAYAFALVLIRQKHPSRKFLPYLSLNVNLTGF